MVHDFDEMLESESSEASERMSSKAVDVRAKPTLREQYFTDRSGIALAGCLSLPLAVLVSGACYVSGCLDLERFVGELVE